MTKEKDTRPTAGTVGQVMVAERIASFSDFKSTTHPRIGQPGTDVFREVRERISAEDAGRYYGLSINRRGWAVCPFHPDRHPSMSFRAGRFRCWACGASGDSIDLTAKLLGLEPMAAVERLDTDFVLALPLRRRQTPAERREAAQAARRRREAAEAHRAFEEWRTDFIAKLNATFRTGHQALNRLERPEDFSGLSERECIAVQLMPHIEDMAEELSHGPPENQAEIYRGRRRTGAWIEALLKNS